MTSFGPSWACIVVIPIGENGIANTKKALKSKAELLPINDRLNRARRNAMLAKRASGRMVYSVHTKRAIASMNGQAFRDIVFL